jgi:hypothetical protein
MTDLVEAVARAIYDSQDEEEWFSDFNGEGRPTFDGSFNCCDAARAAIAVVMKQMMEWVENEYAAGMPHDIEPIRAFAREHGMEGE